MTPRRQHWIALLIVLGSCAVLFAQPAVNFLNSRVQLDANGALLVHGNAYGGTAGPATNVANTRVKIASDGGLIVAMVGGQQTADTICLDSANQDTCITRAAQGVFAQTGASAANGWRIPNAALPEYGGMAWASNFFNIGTTTNGGTARTPRVISATTAVILAPSGTDAYVYTSAGSTTTAGLTSVGRGTPVIVANTRVTAQSAANSSISTFTVGAADGSFEVSGNMNVTASTTLVTTLTCTYTDEANAARTLILPVTSLSGSFIALGAITGAGATVWETPVMHIRAKAATAITILTSAGTFTGVTYTAEGIIKQIS